MTHLTCTYDMYRREFTTNYRQFSRAYSPEEHTAILLALENAKRFTGQCLDWQEYRVMATRLFRSIKDKEVARYLKHYMYVMAWG